MLVRVPAVKESTTATSLISQPIGRSASVKRNPVQNHLLGKNLMNRLSVLQNTKLYEIYMCGGEKPVKAKEPNVEETLP